jgi:hypothetical protein
LEGQAGNGSSHDGPLRAVPLCKNQNREKGSQDLTNVGQIQIRATMMASGTKWISYLSRSREVPRPLRGRKSGNRSYSAELADVMIHVQITPAHPLPFGQFSKNRVPANE